MAPCPKRSSYTLNGTQTHHHNHNRDVAVVHYRLVPHVAAVAAVACHVVKEEEVGDEDHAVEEVAEGGDFEGETESDDESDKSVDSRLQPIRTCKTSVN